MRTPNYKPWFVILAIVLFVGVSFTQQKLNSYRAELGLTRVTPLENAPPILAFTTVALGGFRGLIANALWIRAMEMQEDGKYFEMMQLADWITKLQPHMTSVWVVTAWNMAYNISIKFQDYKDRWQWVDQGIRLLRDQGLKYNPQETLIYRELAWFFQHKIGHNMDDAHLYYKQLWLQHMNQFFTNGRPDYVELLNPTKSSNLVHKLVTEYKMIPKVMKEVDEKYGPLDWRTPETQAIYWAWTGLSKAKREELITLRRVIYQSMQLAFHRGRIIQSKFGQVFTYGPNLDIVEKANRSYEDMMEQDAEMREHIKTGHRNFLKDAVYFLYVQNRMNEANKWFDYLCKKYPNNPLLSTRNDIMPGQMSMEDYALDRVFEDAGETSQDRIRSLIEGLLAQHFENLAEGLEERAINFDHLATKLWARFQKSIQGQEHRVGLPQLSIIKKEVLDSLMSTNSSFPTELQARLATELQLPMPTNAPVAPTNSPLPKP